MALLVQVPWCREYDESTKNPRILTENFSLFCIERGTDNGLSPSRVKLCFRCMNWVEGGGGCTTKAFMNEKMDSGGW